MKIAFMNVSAVVQRFRSELIPHYPVREIESFIVLAFEDIMHYSRLDIFMKGEEEVLPAQIELFEYILDGLRNYEPIQYLIGSTVFYGLPMRVTPDVLIPRPETEELIHWILKDSMANKPRIIDLCTGSGCIALALKDQIADASVYGADLSVSALNIAQENAALNKLNVEFFHFDILTQESLGFMDFDLIVSNPPYVTYSEKAFMAQNVLDNEPHMALFVPDENPLLFYRKITDLADGHLKKSGKLYLEINEAYGKDVMQLLRDRGYADVELKKDFNGKDRMIRATKY
jgi:release factor glutamine methyltransferase